MSDLLVLQSRALEIRQKYTERNLKDGHEIWDAQAYAMGLVGDTGDLLKLVMAKANLRNLEGVTDINSKLGHELSECLWSILVLADIYNIDLNDAFVKNMTELEARIAGEKS